MTRTLTLRPPAKINLSLRVGPLRDDGYHDVVTILQAIELTDTLRFAARRGPLSLEVRGADVVADPTNLVWRAAATLWRATGRAGDPRDVAITLEKKIPSEAGLGGGSSDAAAALAGLNVMWKLDWPRTRLLGLAAELGADVPFFLVGGAALGDGRGEKLLPLADVKRLGVVILKPPFGVATADAYRWLDELCAAAKSRPKVAASEAGLDLGWPTGPVPIINDLQDPVLRRHPELAAAIAACHREGAMAAGMSGSGSAVFGVFAESAASRALRRLRRPGWFATVTRTLSRRETERLIGL
jgi:4-diphosphocytidyl-2-C-methyl-D-erythritol kinase